MFGCCDEYPAQICHAFPIEFQSSYSRSANWRYAQHDSKILVPPEMLAPLVEARIVEWHHRARSGVKCLDVLVFEAITT
jgi:hypothetical protein